MEEQVLVDQQALGRRIADARVDASLTQEHLAAAIGIDRTAVAKIENGSRRVAAVELARIASVVRRPLDWFLVASPPVVLSRRSAADGVESAGLDRQVEQVARDTAFLLDRGILRSPGGPVGISPPRNGAAAEAAAVAVRARLAIGPGPVHALMRMAEDLGLLCFALSLGPDGGDAAYISLGKLGVTVVNGDMDAGRRRFTLAHEIGHHVFGDEYATDRSLADATDAEAVEKAVNAFAVHLLLPRDGLMRRWSELEGSARDRALRLAVEYRVSWSALCGQLSRLTRIDRAEHAALLSESPTRGDFLELGLSIVEEMQPPAVPPGYMTAVLRAYRGDKLGRSRVTELLHGVLGSADLPRRDPLPLDALTREFDQLS